MLATVCTLGNNKNDLKDLCSKGKQPRYKALILGTCYLQGPGKWERQLGREMEQNRKTQPPSRQCSCQLPFQALCPHTSQMLRKLSCLTLQVPFLGSQRHHPRLSLLGLKPLCSGSSRHPVSPHLAPCTLHTHTGFLTGTVTQIQLQLVLAGRKPGQRIPFAFLLSQSLCSDNLGSSC